MSRATAAGAIAALLLATIVACLALVARAATIRSVVNEIDSWSVPKAPSGMFFYPEQGLLYVLCGTQTNGDHYLYAMTTGGAQQCFITIPQSVGMSRVDGFAISGSDAYIVDSQGPIYASEAGKLGGSVYRVDWTNPCGCDSSGACTSSEASWSPTVTATWALSATEPSIGDGGGSDEYFRNSGIVVVGDSFYGVNGVHPNPSLTCCYPKSIVRVNMTVAAQKGAGDAAVDANWAFDATTLDHDIDMEGLTCGSDGCETTLFVGDEYNYIYALALDDADASTAITREWNIRAFVGSVSDDKGIESIAYAPTTGHFYAGIQGSAMVHVVELTDEACASDDVTCYFDTLTLPVASIILAILPALPLLALGCATMCKADNDKVLQKWEVQPEVLEVGGKSFGLQTLRGGIGGSIVGVVGGVLAGLVSADPLHFIATAAALVMAAVARGVGLCLDGNSRANLRAMVGEVVLAALLVVAAVLAMAEQPSPAATSLDAYVYVVAGVAALPPLLLGVRLIAKPDAATTGLTADNATGKASLRMIGGLSLTIAIITITGMVVAAPAFFLWSGIVLLCAGVGRCVGLAKDGPHRLAAVRPAVVCVLGAMLSGMYVATTVL